MREHVAVGREHVDMVAPGVAREHADALEHSDLDVGALLEDHAARDPFVDLGANRLPLGEFWKPFANGVQHGSLGSKRLGVALRVASSAIVLTNENVVLVVAVPTAHRSFAIAAKTDCGPAARTTGVRTLINISVRMNALRCYARIERDRSRSTSRIIHNVVHMFRYYRSTMHAFYDQRMEFIVRFEDDTTTVVHGADTYEQEGPLTTFFDRNGGGRLASAWTVRVASFRTSRILEVRRLEAEAAAPAIAS